jgi:hypothetical protein
LLTKDAMTLFGRGARQVAARFLSPRQYQQRCPAGQAIEREARTDKGHRASLGGYIQGVLAREFLR